MPEADGNVMTVAGIWSLTKAVEELQFWPDGMYSMGSQGITEVVTITARMFLYLCCVPSQIHQILSKPVVNDSFYPDEWLQSISKLFVWTTTHRQCHYLNSEREERTLWHLLSIYLPSKVFLGAALQMIKEYAKQFVMDFVRYWLLGAMTFCVCAQSVYGMFMINVYTVHALFVSVCVKNV